MNNHDLKPLTEILDMCCEHYNKPPMTENGVKLYFGLLQDRSFEQVKHAIFKHLKDSDRGRFMPKVADIESQLQGKELTPDSVLANARNPQDTFGVRCRMQIGTFDLNNSLDSFYLKQRAQECIELCPQWEQEAAQGTFSQNLIEATTKHGIDPRAPFREGLPTPLNQEQLTNQINMANAERKRAMQLEWKNKPPELTEEQKEENQKRIARVLAELEG